MRARERRACAGEPDVNGMRNARSSRRSISCSADSLKRHVCLRSARTILSHAAVGMHFVYMHFGTISSTEPAWGLAGGIWGAVAEGPGTTLSSLPRETPTLLDRRKGSVHQIGSCFFVKSTWKIQTAMH